MPDNQLFPVEFNEPKQQKGLKQDAVPKPDKVSKRQSTLTAQGGHDPLDEHQASELLKPVDIIRDPVQMYLMDVFTVTLNMAGLPGIALPCGFSQEGLPVGMQFIGKVFDEETILLTAHAFEQSTDFHTRKPDL